MNSVKFQITAVLASVLLLPYSSAKNYTVGDSSQWNTGVDYTKWLSGKQFVVGDTLMFMYSSNHDVLEVRKSAYDSCNTGNPINTQSGGMTMVTLGTTGGKWFICGTAGHCAQGMKLAVNVSAATPVSPSPLGATTPPPAATSTTFPPPRPSSVAAALYGRIIDAVVALTLCVVVVLLV